jgi:NAD(P)-dependent dehydrogenase (short-subunit alcohol dehydrogenase family)
MDLKLRGKRALVTGSTAGIGFAIAKGRARESAGVVVNERTEAKLSDAVKRIASDTKASVTSVASDVGSAAEVDRLLAMLEPVDILINNAGILEPKPSSTFPTATGSPF